MATRRVGATWFTDAVEFDNFKADNVYAYYSVDSGPDVQILPKLTVTPYEEDDPDGGESVILYEGAFNGAIPEGAVGSNVVLKIYDPDKIIDQLTYDPIDVCTDEATAVSISPATVRVATGRTQQFTAAYTAADGLPTTNHDPAIWVTSASGEVQGSINIGTGLFTAGTTPGGPYIISMTAGAVNDTAEITVIPSASSGGGLDLGCGIRIGG